MYSSVYKLLEKLAYTPEYYSMGSCSGWIVYVSRGSGGGFTLHAKRGLEERVIASKITDVAPVRFDSNIIVYTIDVTSGREYSRLYATRVCDFEKIDVGAGIKPFRPLGLAFDGKSRVALAASYEDKLSLLLVKLDGSWEELCRLDKPVTITSFDNNLIAGYGFLRGSGEFFDIFLYDLKTSTYKTLSPKEDSSSVNPKVRGSLVLFKSSINGVDKLLIYNHDTGDTRFIDLACKEYSEISGHSWTSSGGVAYIVKWRGRSKLFINNKLVETPRGTLSMPSPGLNKLYVTHESLEEPPRILEVDCNTLKYRVVVDNKAPDEARGCIRRVEVVDIESRDGVKVPTLVVESGRAGRPSPTIVYVHGGPWAEVCDEWNPVITALATLGFHVVAPNYRGSTGYGEEFRRMIVGDPGGGDLEDVAKAGEYALKSGLASKLAILGYSYGGYMTFLALTRKPELWSAGVAGAGITDWVETYKLSDKAFKRFIEALFNKNLELMIERSPVKYAENLKAPLCIIHPKNDTRTPLKPVLEFIRRIHELGKEFEVHVIPEAGHILASPEELLSFLTPAVVFLLKKLSRKR